MEHETGEILILIVYTNIVFRLKGNLSDTALWSSELYSPLEEASLSTITNTRTGGTQTGSIWYTTTDSFTGLGNNLISTNWQFYQNGEQKLSWCPNSACGGRGWLTKGGGVARCKVILDHCSCQAGRSVVLVGWRSGGPRRFSWVVLVLDPKWFLWWLRGSWGERSYIEDKLI